MANRLKSSASKKEKEKDPDLRDFKKESDAQLDVVGILKDERTWKIIGISFIILSLFLFPFLLENTNETDTLYRSHLV
mgnify:CR=1 FL=1